MNDAAGKKTAGHDIKKRRRKVRRIFKALLLSLFGLFLALLFGLYIFVVMSFDSRVRGIIPKYEKWISENSQELDFVFTTIYPEAERCALLGEIPTSEEEYQDHCDASVRSLFDTHLNQVLSYESEQEFSTRRRPIYFLRLSPNNQIEKLFQSGIYYHKPPDKGREVAVVRILQGVRDPFLFPLYTCEGGDDLPCEWWWVSLLLPERNYLKDFPSEAELIFPWKDDSGVIVGAIVILHGD